MKYLSKPYVDPVGTVDISYKCRHCVILPLAFSSNQLFVYSLIIPRAIYQFPALPGRRHLSYLSATAQLEWTQVVKNPSKSILSQIQIEFEIIFSILYIVIFVFI